jgi:hypothetical protein
LAGFVSRTEETPVRWLYMYAKPMEVTMKMIATAVVILVKKPAGPADPKRV